MPLKQYSAATHVGLKRSNNEDTFACDAAMGLWLVADGMGGHAAGEVASKIASDTICESIRSGDNMEQAILASHQAITRAEQQGIGGKGMGSTVVTLQADLKYYALAWVGDSRGYSWLPQTQKLEQLTKDHSYVQLLVDSGALHPRERDNHPDNNMITQCLGSVQVEALMVDQYHGEWREHEWLLLCSDGLSDVVNDTQIAHLLSQSSSLEDANRRLIDAALAEGGKDNITVILVAQPSLFMHFYQRARSWIKR